MIIITGLVAIAVILLIGIGFHYANGARSGKSGVVPNTSAAGVSHTKAQEDRASELN